MWTHLLDHPQHRVVEQPLEETHHEARHGFDPGDTPIAEAQTGHWTSSDIEIEGWSREEVSYHIGLLVDKKLLEATCTAFLGRGHSQYFYALTG